MRVFFTVLIWFVGAVALALALFLAVAQTYTSPDSRFWASSLGYPAMARRFDWPIPVQTEVVGMKEITPSVAAEGTLEFKNLVPIAIDVPGIIVSIEVDVGQQVKKGDPLVKLDLGGREVRMAKLDVGIKRETLRATTEMLESRRQLRERGLIGYAGMYEYERDQVNAKAALTYAEEALKLALSTRSEAVILGIPEDREVDEITLQTILAPIDGYVTSLAVKEGETMVTPRPGAALVGSNLMFRAFVDQLHFEQVKVGQTATIRLQAHSDQPIKGTVAKIEPFVAGRVEARTSTQPELTFAVWLEISPDAAAMEGIARGMNGYVVLSYPTRELVISSRALLRYSGGVGVVLVVADGDQVALRSVKYSWSDGARVAIENGLTPGERVITGGQIALVGGDWVAWE